VHIADKCFWLLTSYLHVMTDTCRFIGMIVVIRGGMWKWQRCQQSVSQSGLMLRIHSSCSIQGSYHCFCALCILFTKSVHMNINSKIQYGQVAQLWHRDCASSINDLRGGLNLGLNYRLLFAPLRHDAIYAYASYVNRTISSTRPSC